MAGSYHPSGPKNGTPHLFRPSMERDQKVRKCVQLHLSLDSSKHALFEQVNGRLISDYRVKNEGSKKKRWWDKRRKIGISALFGAKISGRIRDGKPTFG